MISRGSAAFWLVLLGVTSAGCARLQLGAEPVCDGRPHAAPVPPLERAWAIRLDGSPAAAAPAAGGKYLLVSTRRGELVAVHVETGRRVGSRRLGRALAGPALLVGDLAIVAAVAGGHDLVAYSLRDGRTRWRRRIGDLSGAPVRFAELVVVASLDGGVHARSVIDGEAVWSTYPDSAASIRVPPVLIGELLVVGDDRGAVSALEARTGALVWRTRLGGAVLDELAASDDGLFVTTTAGRSCRLGARDGAVLWCFQAPEPSVRLTGAAADSALVVIGGTDGLLRALDPRDGAERWSTHLATGLRAAPVLAGNLVYAGGLDGQLLVLERRLGEVVFVAAVPGRTHAPVLLVADALVVLSAPRYLTAFASPTPGIAR